MSQMIVIESWKFCQNVVGTIPPVPMCSAGPENRLRAVHPALTGRTGISVTQGRRNHRSRGAIAFTVLSDF